MPQRRRKGTTRKRGLAQGMTPQARAVMRAFRLAKFSASGFVVSCGIFPEISESATDRLHGIVNDLAERRLGKRRHWRDLQRLLDRVVSKPRGGQARGHLDRIEAHLTALLASEATAAYLFGLAVGLAIRSLPDRLGE